MHTVVPMTVVEALYFVWAQGGVVDDASYDITWSSYSLPPNFMPRRLL